MGQHRLYDCAYSEERWQPDADKGFRRGLQGQGFSKQSTCSRRVQRRTILGRTVLDQMGALITRRFNPKAKRENDFRRGEALRMKMRNAVSLKPKPWGSGSQNIPTMLSTASRLSW